MDEGQKITRVEPRTVPPADGRADQGETVAPGAPIYHALGAPAFDLMKEDEATRRRIYGASLETLVNGIRHDTKTTITGSLAVIAGLLAYFFPDYADYFTAAAGVAGLLFAIFTRDTKKKPEAA